MQADPLACLYRHAVVVGDDSLVRKLARVLRADPVLRREADTLLSELPHSDPVTPRSACARASRERMLERVVREYDRSR